MGGKVKHMIQFTEKEVEKIRIRSRKAPQVMERLKKEVQEVYKGEILAPKTGIANWQLYYYCPDCSVSLIFDRTSPYSHLCPHCKKSFSGEPYDSSWWGLVNSSNYEGVYKMAILWLATEDDSYARKAVDIMTEYARNYPNYEVHGNIPYNGPGRSGAQTLDEANFQRTYAMAYDILSDYMTKEEKELVRDSMLLPGAQFLLEHRHRQLHNHEVIINSAIAVIGILFGREDYANAAVYDDYGLVYQLEHGMLPSGMWFEGAFGYHFYALVSFFAFEKFALHTKYSHINHPNYKKMMELPFEFLQPDMEIPMLNDTNYGHKSSMKQMYEFAYRELGGQKLAFILNTVYKGTERDNLEAFLYGADEIEAADLPLHNYHTAVGTFGHTVLRGENGRYLLFKHDSYGGEHDHYDRLSLSWIAFGKSVSYDLGTTGYGAKMHYDYYKNTATHNTMAVGEENQAPVNGILTRYEEVDKVIYVEAKADWTAPYTMPDSFTIVQWKEENYRPVTMTRKIAWTGTYFAEMMICENAPEDQPVDWIMHFSGERVLQPKGGQWVQKETFSQKKPLCYLKDVWETKADQGTYLVKYQDNDVVTHVYGWGSGQSLFLAQGPDNPSTGDIQYLIERRKGTSVICAHVIDTWKEKPAVKEVSFREEGEGHMVIEILEESGEKRIIHF